MQLMSNAFKDGQQIPIQYTKNGDNVSAASLVGPAEGSAGARAAVRERHAADPGALRALAGLRHPAGARRSARRLQAQAEPEEPVELGQGTNAIGNVGYDGPLGTVGKTIRYRFTLVALDRPLDLPSGADKQTVAKNMSGHVLDEAQMTMVHERKG